MSLRLVPVTLATANAFVGQEHRHHAPVVGHRFSIGVTDGAELVGVAIVGRPVARSCDDGTRAEVTRLATNGTKNACSILYAAAARAAAALGYDSIQTYTLVAEPGTSLRAAGWAEDGVTEGGEWHHTDAPTDLFGHTRRTDQPMGPKRRWVKRLRGGAARES